MPPALPTNLSSKLPSCHLFQTSSCVPQIIKNFIYNPDDTLEWSGPLIDANAPRPPIPNIRSFSLPHTTVNRIISRCREEKTTMTALIIMLTALWMGTTYPQHKHFCGKVPFSLRKFSKHSQRDMGNYVSDAELYFSSETKPARGYISCNSSSAEPTTRNDPKLWEGARECKAMIVERSSRIVDQNVGMTRFVSN
jgi:hypothetical protein